MRLRFLSLSAPCVSGHPLLIYRSVLLSLFPSLPSMDDLAHELPLNHRKRKADSDDCSADSQDSRAASDGLMVDTSPAATARLVIPPRLQWPPARNEMWSSPSSPSSCSPVSPQVEYDTYPSNRPKRPRLDMMDSPPSSPTKDAQKIVASDSPKPSSSRVPDAALIDPVAGPSNSHLFRSPRSSPAGFATIDYSSPHIPPLRPPVNRQTLQELELDSILRNPQLRTSDTTSPYDV